MGEPSLQLDLLPEPLGLLRLGSHEPVPDWAATAQHFLCVTRTPGELSIVADAAVMPPTLPPEQIYRAFRVRGPLPLQLVGILAALTAPLAAAQVPIFPIATYDTDYLLVRVDDVSRARQALVAAGHQVFPDAAAGSPTS